MATQNKGAIAGEGKAEGNATGSPQRAGVVESVLRPAVDIHETSGLRNASWMVLLAPEHRNFPPLPCRR